MNRLTLVLGNIVVLQKRQQRLLLIFAYAAFFFALLVHGFWQTLVPVDAANLVLIQSGILVVLLLAAQIWRPLQPLRGFALILLIVNTVTALLIPFTGSSALWHDWFDTENPSFWQANNGMMCLKLASTVLIIAALLLMGLKRADFYLVKDDNAALAGHEKGHTLVEARPQFRPHLLHYHFRRNFAAHSTPLRSRRPCSSAASAVGGAALRRG